MARSRAELLRPETRGSGGSVARPVRRAFLAARGLIGVESLFLFVAGAALVLAAATVSGAALGAGVWIASAAGGLAAGLTWWGSNRVREDALVRVLDRDGRHDGALVTAWEVEHAGTSGPLAQLLVTRVAGRLAAAKLVRAAAPVRPFAPAAPFLAFALFVLALESEGSGRRGDAERAVRMASGAAAHVARVRDLAVEAAETGALEAGEAAQWIRLTARAEDLARQSASGQSTSGELAEELAAIEAELEALAAELAATPELAADLARELADARAFTDAAQNALGAAASPPEAPEPSGSRSADPALGGAAAGSSPSGEGPSGAGAGPTGAGQLPDGTDEDTPALARDATDGTMSAPDPSQAPPSPDGGVPGESELGGRAPSAASALRSWPREYDTLVEGWLRATRADR